MANIKTRDERDAERDANVRQNLEHLTSLGARVEVDYGLCELVDSDRSIIRHGINCECFGHLERPRVARYVVYGAWKELEGNAWPTQQ